jgi:hypothetical protein
VTTKHIQAASRLTDSCEIGMLGAKPGQGELIRVSGGSGSNTASYPAEQQLAALSDLRRVLGRLSERGASVIWHVVLGIPWPERRDVASWAGLNGLDDKVARGLLIAALDTMVDHYFPRERSETEQRIDDALRSGAGVVKSPVKRGEGF